MFNLYKELNTNTLVEAVQFTEENKNKVFNSLTGRYSATFKDGKPALKVESDIGHTLIVALDEWIVKGEKPGMYRKVGDEVFRSNFTRVQKTS